MFHYINQPRTHSFSIGLVKTESESLDQLRLREMKARGREIKAGGSCD